MPVAILSQELHVKILVIGNSSVGKTSLLMRWSENQWLPEDEASATIGVEVLASSDIVHGERHHVVELIDPQRRKLDVNSENVNLTIWASYHTTFRRKFNAHTARCATGYCG